MKYLRYGLFSIVNNPLFNIMIMLELAAILVVGNLTIATANSRSVYYDPYDSVLSEDGIVYNPQFLHNPYDGKETLSELYNSLEGDVSVKVGYYNSIVTRDSRLVDALFESGETQRNCYSFDDEIYSRFNLPLCEGRWASCERNEKGQIEAVICRNGEENINIGDVFSFLIPHVDESGDGAPEVTFDDIGEIVIVGIIADKMYCPQISLGGTENKESVLNLYNVEETNGHFTMYIACGAEEKLCDNKSIGASTAFITYNTAPTDEQRETNEKKLLYLGRSKIINMSDFKRNSDNFLYEQYIKMLPVLLCVFLIVLVELICSVAMNTKEQLRNYGIYFLCGCRWRDVLRISLSYSLIILAGGLMLGGAAMAVFQTTEYAKMFEQNLALNNVWMTLALIGFMLLVSLIIPFVQVSRTSPVSTIKEN